MITVLGLLFIVGGLAILGVIALTPIVFNLRRATALSIASGLVIGAFALWLGTGSVHVPGLVVSIAGTVELAAALVGLSRRWLRGSWIRALLCMSSISLAVLWSAALVQVFRPRPPLFVEPLAELPPGCPEPFEAETRVAPTLEATDVRAALTAGRMRIHRIDGRTIEVDRPRAPTVDAPQWMACDQPAPILIGQRAAGEYCVGYDSDGCSYFDDPHVLILDNQLRPWPNTLTRLEARCGSLIERWFLFAGSATIALMLLGCVLRRRWNALLRSTRWHGTLEETQSGWVLWSGGNAHRLDLRRARVLDGKLASGECCLVARTVGDRDPYRKSLGLRVDRIACGDAVMVSERISRMRARMWAIVLAAIATISVPVLLAVLDAFRFAPK